MRLALAILLLLAATAGAEEAGRLRSEAGVLRGPAAEGALVWLPGYTREGTPAAPDWVAGLRGWDLWRFDRGAADPLEGGAIALAEGAAALRARGYRRVALLGESRGAFIALVALREAGLADAVILAAPAAHGRSPERRAQALADYALALADARPDATARIALFLFEGDGWDPNPPRRAELFREAAGRLGMATLLVDRPDAPTGHGGLQEPAFAARFGGCMTAFLDFGRAPPSSCP